jgi:hypothetical protein
VIDPLLVELNSAGYPRPRLLRGRFYDIHSITQWPHPQSAIAARQATFIEENVIFGFRLVLSW